MFVFQGMLKAMRVNRRKTYKKRGNILSMKLHFMMRDNNNNTTLCVCVIPPYIY